MQTLRFIGTDAGFGEHNNAAYVCEKEHFILMDCGFAVFSEIKNRFDWKQYTKIDVIITHLHNDHAGSLSQFILFLFFVYHKQVNIITKCQHMRDYLDMTGTPKEAYTLQESNEFVSMIPTKHVDGIDSYGFQMIWKKRKIVYTGDTCILDPFLEVAQMSDEFYVDVSKGGGVHLQIDDIMPQLEDIQKHNTEIYFMHLDDRAYIQKETKEKIQLAKET